MKVYVTKYALTTGIQELEAETTGVEGMICIPADRSKGWTLEQLFHGQGREWHTDRAAAVAKAETMRQAKIASVKKQLAKLEAMTF